MSVVAQEFLTQPIVCQQLQILEGNSLNSIESFTSINGAKHYDVPTNSDTIKLIKGDKPIFFQES